jgi:hypothetical protein
LLDHFRLEMATEEKVELSEQTPLNLAEFPTLNETVAEPIEQSTVVQKEKEHKKWWFGKKVSFLLLCLFEMSQAEVCQSFHI